MSNPLRESSFEKALIELSSTKFYCTLHDCLQQVGRMTAILLAWEVIVVFKSNFEDSSDMNVLTCLLKSYLNVKALKALKAH
jgi:hypothetical protein